MCSALAVPKHPDQQQKKSLPDKKNSILIMLE